MAQSREARYVNDLLDLRNRLSAADKELDGLSLDAGPVTERTRLQGKAEGVRLAISYVDDVLRARPRT